MTKQTTNVSSSCELVVVRINCMLYLHTPTPLEEGNMIVLIEKDIVNKASQYILAYSKLNFQRKLSSQNTRSDETDNECQLELLVVRIDCMFFFTHP
ncbi:hypothetical protein [Flavobacterium pokkalii]|uniref:hypothetical protein n=1 Tax=Flavobacterium pokkalii TaxID=1940408 RepID=UPI0016607B58|nr:hypothetical protein [Flavobacterium pokkalii]